MVIMLASPAELGIGLSLAKMSMSLVNVNVNYRQMFVNRIKICSLQCENYFPYLVIVIVAKLVCLLHGNLNSKLV